MTFSFFISLKNGSRSRSGAVASMITASSGLAIWITQSFGQKVVSRMNSVSTVTTAKAGEAFAEGGEVGGRGDDSHGVRIADRGAICPLRNCRPRRFCCGYGNTDKMPSCKAFLGRTRCTLPILTPCRCPRQRVAGGVRRSRRRFRRVPAMRRPPAPARALTGTPSRALFRRPETGHFRPPGDQFTTRETLPCTAIAAIPAAPSRPPMSASPCAFPAGCIACATTAACCSSTCATTTA